MILSELLPFHRIGRGRTFTTAQRPQFERTTLLGSSSRVREPNSNTRSGKKFLTCSFLDRLTRTYAVMDFSGSDSFRGWTPAAGQIVTLRREGSASGSE